ncbi:MAG: heavy-metal-associated domain-containing protein [Bacteroidetes bacterium]|nr:heavy-metal-associated domain-containing protein [Bacteroidota bacterium]
MSTFKKTGLLLLLIFSIFKTEAQTKKAAESIKTVTFTVSGNCEECKARIENAADIKGVKLCVWDIKTHVATVTYNESKTNPDKIKKAIADAGHDVTDFRANDEAYKKLPSCCKYRDGECKNH